MKKINLTNLRVILVALVLTAGTLASAQYSNWQYLRVIQIENPGPTVTNHQVMVLLNTQILADSGKLSVLCPSIRFASDCEGLNPLDFYIDGACPSTETRIWVKIPVLNNASNLAIYMFYGNAAAGPVSDFDATFPPATRLEVGAGQTVVLAGTNVYSWVDVQSGGTIEQDTLNGRQLLRIEAPRMRINGRIFGNAKGYEGSDPDRLIPAGGPGKANGFSGGGAHGGDGGDAGGSPGSGGDEVLPVPPTIEMGSGGGDGNCGSPSPRGGDGGGAVHLITQYLGGNNSLILMNGQDGSNGVISTPVGTLSCVPTGAGSGGGCLIQAYDLGINGDIEANGGDGQSNASAANGNGSGGGGGGIIKVEFELRNTGSQNTSVQGGLGGPNINGTPGFPGASGKIFNTSTAIAVPRSNVLSETVQGEIVLTSNDATHEFCKNNPIVLTATPGFESYIFRLNGNQTIQSGSSNIYTSSNFVDGDKVHVTGSLGACTEVSDTLTLTVYDLPIVTAQPVADQCEFGPPVMLFGNPNGGKWWHTDLAGAGIRDSFNQLYYPSDVTAGNYIVTYGYTDANGCFDSAKISISVLPSPDATFASAGPFCGNDPVFDLVEVNAGGTFSGPGIVDANQGLFDPMTAGQGTHRIVYTLSANGCDSRDTQFIQVYGVPNMQVGNTGPFCSTDGPKTFQFSPTGGTWSGTGVTNTSLGIFEPATVGVGSYPVTYSFTDAQGCVTEVNRTVQVTSAPQAFAGPDKLTCSGTGIQIGANPAATGGNPPYIYSWIPSATISNPSLGQPIAAPTVTTDYTLRVTDNSGCRVEDTVQVEVTPQLVVSAGPDVTICDLGSSIIGGAPTAIGGNPGYLYSWTPVTGLSFNNVPNPSASPRQTTTYTICVTDKSNCVECDQITVFVNQIPTANAGPDVDICSGEDKVIGVLPLATGGSGSYSYAWAPTPTNIFSNGLARVKPTLTTKYTLTVTDSKGCEREDSVVVNVFQSPFANAGPDVKICNSTPQVLGGSPTGTGGSGGFTFSWLPTTGLTNPGPNHPNPQAKVTSPTTYTVTVTDSRGCVGTDQVLVDLLPSPIADAGPNITLCSGASVIVGGTPSTAKGGIAPYSYKWMPGNLTAPKPSVNPSLPTQYSLTITDANGCEASDRVMVNIIDNFNSSFTGLNFSYCASDEPVKLIGSPAAGTFSGPGIISQGAVVTGTYQGAPLPIPDNDTIGAIASFVVSTNGTDILGQNIFLSSVEVDVSHTFIGDLELILISPNGTQIPLINRPGVPAKSSTGCGGDNLQACFVPGTGNPLKAENICFPDVPAINGMYSAVQDLNLMNNGGKVFGIWKLIANDYKAGDVGSINKFAIKFGKPATFDPGKAGAGSPTIKYTYADCYGCTHESQSSAIVYPIPTVDAGAPVEICDGKTVVIGGAPTASGTTAPYSYVWTPTNDNNAPFNANPPVHPNESVYYKVEVRDARNCVAHDSVLVTVLDKPIAGFHTTETGLEVEFMDQSIDADSFYYEFGDPNSSTSSMQNPVFTFPQAGPYIVCLTVFHSNGCKDKFCNTVYVSTVGMEEEFTSKGIKVYPVPVSDMLNVEWDNGSYQPSHIQIVDITGQVVKEVGVESFNINALQIDMTKLASGSYFVRFDSEEGNISYPIVKLR